MNAANFDRRITIQSKTVSVDDEGINTPSWENVVTIWALREPLRGREFQEAAANNAENTARYKIRSLKGIEADMRIIDHKIDCICNIIARPEEAKDDRSMLVIMVREELQNG